MSIEAKVNEIFADIEATFSRPNDVIPAINHASAALKGLVPVTEVDRVHQLVGFTRLMDMLIELSGQDVDLVRQRSQITETLQRRYGSAQTPYLRSRSIIEDLAARLAAGEDAGGVTNAAVAEIRELPFDDIDRPAQVTALVAVQSLFAAYGFFASPQPASETGGLMAASLKMLDAALRLGGFEREILVDGARKFRESRASFDETPEGHAQALMVILGIGLRANPTALPALEPICEWLIEALAEAGQPQAATPQLTFAERCDAIIARFQSALATDGFSEYVLRQGIADLQELKTSTVEESETLRAALARLVDIASPLAPAALAQSLAITRDAVVQMGQTVDGPLNSSELRARAEGLVQTLRDELASGVAIEPAVTKAVVGLQLLATRVRDDDEETVRDVLAMMPNIMQAVVPYVDGDKQHLAEDVNRTMSGFFGQVPAMLDAEGVDLDLESRAASRSMSRDLNTMMTTGLDEAATDPIRQFLSLGQPILARLAALANITEDRRYDRGEATRVRDCVKIAMDRIRATTTENQWVHQQRSSMRPALVALRQFERRQHLMVIEPSWPVQPVAVDANAVYFSGLPAARPPVEAAMARLGMTEAIAHGVDDPIHTKWNLLRRSAVAVFDFTNFDRAASDPPGPLPASRARLDAITRAAAPTAQVAYEYGWAITLGVPTVALARADQAMPFDIDVEPVRLRAGTGDDEVLPIVLGFQAAIIGGQREARANVDLAATVAHLRNRFSSDAGAAEVLRRLDGSSDAIGVQLGAESLLERPNGHGAMLAWPAYQPVYPATSGRRSLFHVTAFRPWSRACEETLRACCGTDLEYRIGYEDIDPDILGAIWRDIASAAIVVADLTLLNPNAALELGIAHALGRPTLVITQTPDLVQYLPALAKVRTHQYTANAAGRKVLRALVRRFAEAAPRCS